MTAVTIGAFDGIHLGHQLLFKQVQTIARERGLRPAVLTFDPHPARVLAPERAPKLITTLEERCALIQQMGISDIHVLPFTLELSRLTPEQFVEQVLVQRLEAKAIVVGSNFHFGHKQAGHIDDLQRLGLRYGFTTHAAPILQYRRHIVSSTTIRRAIVGGNVALANRLLGRPYALSGKVVSGHGIGSRQTVPTLNLETTAEVLPANGVYITRTRDLNSSRTWNSITNVGTRPTFDGDTLSIETYLLDPFDGENPARIRVELLRHIREERRFSSPEALKTQILHDVGRAQAFFRRTAKLRPVY